MLGTTADAEEVVQDAYLRLHTSAPRGIDNIEAWLTAVTTRLAIDRFRRLRRERLRYTGPWLPEPWVEFPAETPETAAERTSQLSYGLLLLLEKLTAPERAAFVLRHYEGLSIEEIGAGKCRVTAVLKLDVGGWACVEGVRADGIDAHVWRRRLRRLAWPGWRGRWHRRCRCRCGHGRYYRVGNGRAKKQLGDAPRQPDSADGDRDPNPRRPSRANHARESHFGGLCGTSGTRCDRKREARLSFRRRFEHPIDGVCLAGSQ